VPEGSGTRPTSERVREAIHNSLYSLGAIDGARVLDAFAGSGAMGFEALSRGADHVTFAEIDPEALDVLDDNIDTLGVRDAVTVAPGDGVSAAATVAADLVVLDPPYAWERWDDLLAAVAEGSPGATVVIESRREVTLPDGWDLHRTRRYGATVVTLATAPPGDSET